MRFALDVTNLWYSPDPFQHQNAGHINSHLEPTSHFESYPANIVQATMSRVPSLRNLGVQTAQLQSIVSLVKSQKMRKLKGQGVCTSLVKESTKRFQVPRIYIYIIYNHMYIFLDRWMIYKYSLRICQVSLQYI